MGQKKLLLLILQELNSINSKLYKSQDPEPRIAMKQRVSESRFANRMSEAMDILKDGIDVKPQVGILDALANPQGPKINP